MGYMFEQCLNLSQLFKLFKQSFLLEWNTVLLQTINTGFLWSKIQEVFACNIKARKLIFLKNRKFRDPAWKILGQLPCSLENPGSICLRFEKSPSILKNFLKTPCKIFSPAKNELYRKAFNVRIRFYLLVEWSISSHFHFFFKNATTPKKGSFFSLPWMNDVSACMFHRGTSIRGSFLPPPRHQFVLGKLVKIL